MVETECAQVVEVILDRSCRQLYRILISKIQELCRRQWRVIIKKIPREVDVNAHSLVGKMKVFPYAPIVFQKSLEMIVDQLRLDCRLMHDDTKIML